MQRDDPTHMRFIGIDLAWKDTNASGLVVLDHLGHVVDERWPVGNADVRCAIAAHDEHGAVVTMDAPIVIPDTGSRHCDLELQQRYGGRHAGPYTATLAFLKGTRAADILASCARAYEIVSIPPVQRSGWWAVEVFPHPSIVELAGLSRTIKYKRGTLAERRHGLHRLHRFLIQLAQSTPPLKVSPDGELQRLAAGIDTLPGHDLKTFEDLADAHVCAFIGLWAWWHGTAGAEAFGTAADGAILVAQRVAGSSPIFDLGAPLPNDSPQPRVHSPRVVRPSPSRPCLCGCGGIPRGGEFLPGHDAKLKSALLRAARDPNATAKARLVTRQRLDARGWGHFLGASAPGQTFTNAPPQLDSSQEPAG